MSIYQVDGVQYGLPYNFGLVGFWYNKDLFEQAGITEPPATWEEFLDGRPDAQGRRHHAHRRRGPATSGRPMFCWAYLALRIGGQAALEEAIATGDWTDRLRRGRQPAQAAHRPRAVPGGLPGRHLRRRPGGRHGQRQGGHGAPGPVGARRAAGQQRIQGRHRRSLGWFPFPEVDGGAGLPTDVFGGGDGYRGRQGCAARGRRLPEVPQQPRRWRSASPPSTPASCRPPRRPPMR